MLFWILFLITILFGSVVFIGAPYLPSKKRNLWAIFKKINLNKDDILVDIGSGDGLVLRIASKFGAKAIGYEINPVLVLISKACSVKNPLVITKFSNFWYATFPPETTIFYTFGDGRDIQKMFNLAQNFATKHKKSIRFISFGFNIKDKQAILQDSGFYVYKILP